MTSSIAHPMPALNITRQHVGQAQRQMREECRYNSREVNAINRAGLLLESVQWQWDGETLVIESETTQFVKYTVQHDGCSCKAGQTGRPCKHMAAFVLLNRAAQLAMTPPKSRKTYDEIIADVDELFS